MPSDLEAIRILMAVVMLAIGTIWDIKKREVNDVLWLVFGVSSIVLFVLESSPVDRLIDMLFSLIIAPIAIIIWRLGIFGGADAFALIVLSMLAPFSSLTDSEITPFTTVTNAAILSLVPMAINATRNCVAVIQHHNIFEGFNESKKRKVLASILGHRSPNPKFSFSIQQTENGEKKFSFSMHHAEKTEFCNSKDTWVTQGIPYMLYIFGGFVIQLVYGDIIFGHFNF